MADLKYSELADVVTPAATDEWGVNQGGASKSLTLAQVQDYIIKRAAGTSTAAGEFLTWLVLSANSSDITGTSFVTVMTMTGVGVGRYYFKCQLIYQTTATTTGIQVAVNHTGTTTQFIAQHGYAGNANTATTAAASAVANNAAGNCYSMQSTRTKNAIIGAVTVSVDSANTDMLSTIEGFFVVSATGSLEIKLAAESAGLVCRAMQGAHLELRKLST